MFCRYCGSQMEDDSVFCGKCGKKVGAQEVSSQPEPSQPAADLPVTQRKLVVQRKKHVYGCAVSLGILIDDVEVARVDNGGEATVMISSESHALHIKQDNFGGKFKSKAFVIKAGTGPVYGYIKPPMFSDKWTITLEYVE